MDYESTALTAELRALTGKYVTLQAARVPPGPKVNPSEKSAVAKLLNPFFRIPGTLQLADHNDLPDMVGVVGANVRDGRSP